MPPERRFAVNLRVMGLLGKSERVHRENVVVAASRAAVIHEFPDASAVDVLPASRENPRAMCTTEIIGGAGEKMKMPFARKSIPS